MKDVFDYGKYTQEEIKDYLNQFYKSYKNLYGSKAQSVGFYRYIIDNLPQEIIGEIYYGSILDWGCGEGTGTLMLQHIFPKAIIDGIDISESSIERANNTITKHFGINYYVKILDNEKYDLIINSNCLEHFKNPVNIVEKHLKYNTNKYYILLVPYMGRIVDNISDHLVTIDDTTFPVKLGNASIVFKHIDHLGSYGSWNGYQMLIIYKKDDI